MSNKIWHFELEGSLERKTGSEAATLYFAPLWLGYIFFVAAQLFLVNLSFVCFFFRLSSRFCVFLLFPLSECQFVSLPVCRTFILHVWSVRSGPYFVFSVVFVAIWITLSVNKPIRPSVHLSIGISLDLQVPFFFSHIDPFMAWNPT